VPKKIAIVGPGAVGCALGGFLSKAGHRVWLLDPWAEHIDALKTRGLRITIGGRFEHGEFVDLDADHRVPMRAYHVFQACMLRQEFDIAFITSKSYETAWMARLIAPYLAPDGFVVAAQGGVTEDTLAEVVGEGRVVGCALHTTSWLVEPDIVWQSKSHSAPEAYTVGELDGSQSSRLAELVELMSDAGATSSTTDIRSAKWSVLAAEVARDPLVGLTGLELAALAGNSQFESVAACLSEETVAVAAALGFAVEPHATRMPAEGHRDTVSQDLARGRKTEVADGLNGYVARTGREAGVATPVNEALVELIGRVESGEVGPDIANLEVLQAA